jgi:monoamine oxidase
MALTRRDFLRRTTAAGGYSAGFMMMHSLGLLGVTNSVASVINAAPDIGKGAKVAILGGGIAGLSAAYELGKLEYTCTLLEVRDRPGGRNWSVRRGTKIALNDHPVQTCAWDEGHYQNFGPARLPSIHGTILGYCRELGVELEVEVNSSRSSLLQNDSANDGQPILQRQAINDTRGYISELLDKCIHKGALDEEISKDDVDRIKTMLRSYGPLDNTGKYVGSTRSGYTITPGAGDQSGEMAKPIDLNTLMNGAFWNSMLFEETFDMQATMFQPKGGMDRIPYAFAAKLGSVIQYNSEVKEIRKTSKGVRVTYVQHGAENSIEADYCFVAVPLTILKNTSNDFSDPYKRIFQNSGNSGLYKVAWESRRFWEQDYNIYGGISFLAQGPSPIWYPSANMFSQRGILVGGYSSGSNTPFDALTLEEKFSASRASIERLHPGHGKELENPLYVGWNHVPHNLTSMSRVSFDAPTASGLEGGRRGSAGQNGEARGSNPAYEQLITPDGPLYIIGDHAAHVGTWQEGAALSAHRAVKLLNDRVKAARLASGHPSTAA